MAAYTNVYAGYKFSITPSLSDYTFTPASITLANITENKPNQNFVATKMNIAETGNNSLLQVCPNPTTGELLVTNNALPIKYYVCCGNKIS